MKIRVGAVAPPDNIIPAVGAETSPLRGSVVPSNGFVALRVSGDP